MDTVSARSDSLHVDVDRDADGAPTTVSAWRIEQGRIGAPVLVNVSAEQLGEILGLVPQALSSRTPVSERGAVAQMFADAAREAAEGMRARLVSCAGCGALLSGMTAGHAAPEVCRACGAVRECGEVRS